MCTHVRTCLPTRPLRSRLARELLSLSDYDTTDHLRTMELLKLRFGDAPLHACEVGGWGCVYAWRPDNAPAHTAPPAAALLHSSACTCPPVPPSCAHHHSQVMLKDMADSKRVNTNIQRLANSTRAPASSLASSVQLGGLQSPQQHSAGGAGPAGAAAPLPLSATIMSHLFWPALGGWGDEQVGGGHQPCLTCVRACTCTLPRFGSRRKLHLTPRNVHGLHTSMPHMRTTWAVLTHIA